MKNEQQPVNTYDALNNTLAQLVRAAGDARNFGRGAELATIAHAICTRIGRAVAAALREACGLDAS